MADILRYVTPSAPTNPLAAPGKDPNAELFAAGGNKLTPTPPPPAAGGTSTGGTPLAPTTSPTVDPVADYYNKLADPSVADQPVKDLIQKNLQLALDSIDQRFAPTYQREDAAALDRSGQTRAITARSGTLGSDFGAEAAAATDTANKNSRAAIDSAKAAEQDTVRLDANNQLTKLAADEIAAKKADALGQAQNAKTLFDKAITDSQALITKLSGTGATLTDAQKSVLMRNSGYDEATFDSIYNAGLPANQKGEITYHTIKKADGSEALLQIITKSDGTTTQKEMAGYNTGGQVVKEYGGRPYVQTQDAQGNIVLKPIAGFVQSSTDSINQETGKYNLMVKQAPAQVAALKEQGYNWGDTVNYFNKLKVDVGTPELDDALHKAYMSESDYDSWKSSQAAKKVTAIDALIQTLARNAVKQ